MKARAPVPRASSTGVAAGTLEHPTAAHMVLHRSTRRRRSGAKFLADSNRAIKYPSGDLIVNRIELQNRYRYRTIAFRDDLELSSTREFFNSEQTLFFPAEYTTPTMIVSPRTRVLRANHIPPS